MAAGATYFPIATTTLGSAQASVTFSSISGAYTDLVLIINGGNASGNYATAFRFNGDTGSNYSVTRLYGNGTTATSDRGASQSFIYLLAAGQNNLNGVQIINIQNYSNSTTYKTTISRSNTAGNTVGAEVGLWRSTAAITSIVLAPEFSVNWLSGTTFTLYGIEYA
jgi:hypothetical protein